MADERILVVADLDVRHLFKSSVPNRCLTIAQATWPVNTLANFILAHTDVFLAVDIDFDIFAIIDVLERMAADEPTFRLNSFVLCQYESDNLLTGPRDSRWNPLLARCAHLFFITPERTLARAVARYFVCYPCSFLEGVGKVCELFGLFVSPISHRTWNEPVPIFLSRSHGTVIVNRDAFDRPCSIAQGLERVTADERAKTAAAAAAAAVPVALPPLSALSVMATLPLVSPLPPADAADKKTSTSARPRRASPTRTSPRGDLPDLSDEE